MERGAFGVTELRLETESTMRRKGLDAMWKRRALTPILLHRDFHPAPFFLCDLEIYTVRSCGLESTECDGRCFSIIFSLK